jgi:Proto-chlorophyllide reductase 57 kD subunit
VGKYEQIMMEKFAEIIMTLDDGTDELKWTVAAKQKLKNIPFFARNQARQRIEALVRNNDSKIVTAEIVDRARSEFGQ